MINRRQALVDGLKKIHQDYKKDGVIYSIGNYETPDLSRGVLRKLCEQGPLRRISSSKKNMQYEWIAGDNPDYSALATTIMMTSLEKLSNPVVIPDSARLTKIAILLFKAGVDENKIPELTIQISKL
jgi:hypothetical protein